MNKKEIHQSGVIPYRFKKDRLEVLLITSNGKGKLIFPKGYVSRGLTPVESAEQEAFEEAGVKGKITGPKIGDYRYQKKGKRFWVDMYPLKVTQVLTRKNWLESGSRDREWMEIINATQYIYYEALADMLSRMEGYTRGRKKR